MSYSTKQGVLEKAFGGVGALKGKENWVDWEMEIENALGKAGVEEMLEEAPPDFTSARERKDWEKLDSQIANWILSATQRPIFQAHFHLIRKKAPITASPSSIVAPPPHLAPGRARVLFQTLKATYGTSNVQYIFALGRRFIDSTCELTMEDPNDVSGWINKVKAQHTQLKCLNFDLDALCVNVLLHGLPDRFNPLVDTIWTAPTPPTIDSVCDSILRVDAGHKDRDQDEATFAMTARVKKLAFNSKGHRSKGPSKQNPCRCCGSWKHWEKDCPDQEELDQAGEANLAEGGYDFGF